MKNSKPIKKSIIAISILICSVTMLAVVPIVFSPSDTAYAASNDVIYYADNGEYSQETETITYATKDTSPLFRVNNSFPAYYNMNDALTNACANVAGANLIGYYDRYFENLIPDFVPGIKRGSNYNYYPMTTNATKVQALIDELYIRMGTNSTNIGTSQTDYKNGITSYVNSKGRNVSYSSVMTGGSLDINKVQQSINNGTPVSLYLSGYNIVTLSDNSSSASLTKYLYTGDHIMIVYGYQTIDYFDGNHNLIKSNTYLYVATGTTRSGYYLLNNNGTINDAESVHIS